MWVEESARQCRWQWPLCCAAYCEARSCSCRVYMNIVKPRMPGRDASRHPPLDWSVCPIVTSIRVIKMTGPHVQFHSSLKATFLLMHFSPFTCSALRGARSWHTRGKAPSLSSAVSRTFIALYLLPSNLLRCFYSRRADFALRVPVLLLTTRQRACARQPFPCPSRHEHEAPSLYTTRSTALGVVRNSGLFLSSGSWPPCLPLSSLRRGRAHMAAGREGSARKC